MAKKRGTSKAGKKFIAGMVATAIIAGAGVAGGMAIQNAYADPNAGGDITRLETNLTTEKASHEATKAELAEVKTALEAEKAKDVQDEARIAELEAKVAELEQQLTRDETKLYFDELYSEIPNVRIVYLDEDSSFIYALGYGGAYLMNNKTYVLTRVSVQAYHIASSVSTDNYVFIYSHIAGYPCFIFDKTTHALTEVTFDIDMFSVSYLHNDCILFTSNDGNSNYSVVWDLSTNTEVCRINADIVNVIHIDDNCSLMQDSWTNWYIVNLDTGAMSMVNEVAYDGQTEDTSLMLSFNRIDTDAKIIYFVAENSMTGNIKGYEFNYETMTGVDAEVRIINLLVFNYDGVLSQFLSDYIVGTPTIDLYFLNNPNLGTTSASVFSKFAVADSATGEVVEVGTDFVLDETVSDLHIYW